MKSILFITRKYPPQIGGMEKYCFELVENLKKHFEVKLIANRKSQIILPFFYVYALIAGTFKGLNSDLIYLGDTVMAPLGWILKTFTGKKTAITVYGLDLTYENYIYRNFVLPFVKKMDQVICISSNTKDIAIKTGISEDNLIVINIGIDKEKLNSKIPTEKKWGESFGISEEDIVLVTVGRLVERKGVKWFIKNVLSKISEKINPSWKYFIIGRGKEEEKIRDIIKSTDLRNNVFLLTDINNLDRDAFYKYSDLFIMPNIHVENDLEGFGIVAIEAGARGLPVFTSGIEGISDAIIKNKTAITYKDKEEAKNKLLHLLNTQNSLPTKNSIKKAVLKKYDWKEIIKKYKKIINETI